MAPRKSTASVVDAVTNIDATGATALYGTPDKKDKDKDKDSLGVEVRWETRIL